MDRYKKWYKEEKVGVGSISAVSHQNYQAPLILL